MAREKWAEDGLAGRGPYRPARPEDCQQGRSDSQTCEKAVSSCPDLSTMLIRPHDVLQGDHGDASLAFSRQ
jgi:hypothetical protein